MEEVEIHNIEAIEAEAIEALMSYQDWLDQSTPEDIEQYLERLYEYYGGPEGPAPF